MPSLKKVKNEFEKKSKEEKKFLQRVTSSSSSSDLEGSILPKIDVDDPLLDLGEPDLLSFPAPTVPVANETYQERKDRFSSLREEISKTRKKKTRINIDPSDLVPPRER